MRVIAAVAVVAGALAACSDPGASADAGSSVSDTGVSAGDGGVGDAVQDTEADATDPFGGKDALTDGGDPSDASDASDGMATGDAAAEVAPQDAGAGDAGEAPCPPIEHSPLTQIELGDIPIAAASEEALTLHWRRALPGEAFTTVPLAGSATIPGSAVTFAGIDYWIGSSCASHPAGAPAEVHHVDVIGELRITTDPGVYDYLPDVDGHRVVWAKEEKGGTADNVYLFDLHTFQTTKLTSLQKPQGDAHISGDNVVWVDGRNAESAWDPNQDVYLWDLAAGKESPLATAPLGQYGVAIAGRIVAWRDDRHMSGPIDGDIYLFDLGPDGVLGTGDDQGEHRLTPHPADQTAPAVAVDADGRARVVWADMRDDADGKCDQVCDWNIYLHDAGPDGVFGTEDDQGPLQVTSHPAEQHSPSTWGRRIAWLDARGGNWLDPDVWVYDLGPDHVLGTADDGGESQLPVPVVEPGHLSMWGDRMVYEDFRNETWDLWLWDFAKGTEAPLVTEPFGQFYPRVQGRTVVWQDARNNGVDGEAFDDIYVRVLPK
ncbi:MAG: hypothetical protein AMXMBFR64_26230 [Myxococcales bacterium]